MRQKHRKFKAHSKLIWLSTCCFFIILRNVESLRKKADANTPPSTTPHHHHHSGSTHGHHHHHHHIGAAAGSEEEGVTISAPEMIAMKGMASAGITHLKSSGKMSKCLGHDLRTEKIVQVTKHCDTETEEGQGETPMMQGKSLCFTACMYKYLGLIGDDLMFTAKIDDVVVDVFPPIAHLQAKRALRNCAKQSVLPLSKADNCSSFGPVKGCIMKSAQNICNGEYY